MRLRLFTALTITLLFLLAGQGRAAPTPQPLLTPRVYLPFVAVAPPQNVPNDILPYLLGDGRLYEVQRWDGSQARHQTQTGGGSIFYHTKGSEFNAEWEELWYDNNFIYRGTDTSPGNNMYYTLRDNGQYGSKWAPRSWALGGIFYREPLVQFFNKSDCSLITAGVQPSWLRYSNYFPSLTFYNNVTVNDVIELTWQLTLTGAPIERYYYARDFGLVGWWSPNFGISGISEIHEPGTRPDNLRENIPCLDQNFLPDYDQYGLLPRWLGEHRR